MQFRSGLNSIVTGAFNAAQWQHKTRQNKIFPYVFDTAKCFPQCKHQFQTQNIPILSDATCLGKHSHEESPILIVSVNGVSMQEPGTEKTNQLLISYLHQWREHDAINVTIWPNCSRVMCWSHPLNCSVMKEKTARQRRGSFSLLPTNYD